jgi:hypothetical protein
MKNIAKRKTQTKNVQRMQVWDGQIALIGQLLLTCIKFTTLRLDVQQTLKWWRMKSGATHFKYCKTFWQVDLWQKDRCRPRFLQEFKQGHILGVLLMVPKVLWCLNHFFASQVTHSAVQTFVVHISFSGSLNQPYYKCTCRRQITCAKNFSSGL